jgi:hypothetical protein
MHMWSVVETKKFEMETNYQSIFLYLYNDNEIKKIIIMGHNENNLYFYGV